MSDVNGENSRVTFTVKELFAQIKQDLGSIDSKLDAKADTKDLDFLSVRVNAQGERMASLERRIDSSEQILKDRDRAESLGVSKKTLLIGTVLWVASILVPVVTSGVIH